MRFPLTVFLTCGLGTSGLATPALADVPAPSIPAFPLLAPDDFAVLAYWTQFVGQPADPVTKALPDNRKIEMRFVLTGDRDCDGVQVAQTGAAVATPAKRGTLQGGGHFVTTAGGGRERLVDYTVTICAAPLAASATEASLDKTDGAALVVYPTGGVAQVPGPARLGQASGDPSKITGIAMGDSGCRGAAHGQVCRDANGQRKNWFLAEIASDAAALKPDFVLHVADYHYFYEDDQAFWDSQNGQDKFGYWLQEFLIPAAPLLHSAPWLFGRGNHERCSGQWVGNAWHILFDARPALAGDVSCSEGIPPTWAVDLAPADGKTAPFRFMMIDSAQGGSNFAGYAQAKDAGAPFDGAKLGWISHYPPLKLAQWNVHGKETWHSTNGTFGLIQSNMADAVRPCVTDKPCMPSVVFAGHQHFFQEFTFDPADALPVIQIIGHAGVMIGTDQMPGYRQGGNSSTCMGDFASKMPFAMTNGANATLRTAQVFGFLELTRDAGTDANPAAPSGWDTTLHWAGLGAGETVEFPMIAGSTCPD